MGVCLWSRGGEPDPGGSRPVAGHLIAGGAHDEVVESVALEVAPEILGTSQGGLSIVVSACRARRDDEIGLEGCQSGRTGQRGARCFE